ncbi:MAG: hypothetical protein KGI60_00645 [Patescibacteria group bacterium]|nr:hypothetical protein [Patescibacteria group bacterium]
MKRFGDVYEDFIRSKGYEPINPFAFERGPDGKFRETNIEDGYVGREVILELGLGVQTKCPGGTGVLGISEGVMGEVRDRVTWEKYPRIRIFRYDDSGKAFFERWDPEYARLSLLPEYGDVFADVRSRYHRLIVFVGPSAVGKNYCMNRLWSYCGALIRPIRNVTTRPMRDPGDADYYHHVSRAQFDHGLRHQAFFEYSDYLGVAYGSSLDAVKETLQSFNGMFALTPEGAMAYYAAREELDISFIVLKPASDEVLARNLLRRKEMDPQKVAKKIAEAKRFVLPSHVPHKVVTMTGEEADVQRMFDVVLPLMK